MEILLMVIWVPALNYLVQQGKQRFAISWEIVLVLMAILIWIVYTAFQMILPELLQTVVYDFVGKVGLLSVLVYEFFIKKVLPPQE